MQLPGLCSAPTTARSPLRGALPHRHHRRQHGRGEGAALVQHERQSLPHDRHHDHVQSCLPLRRLPHALPMMAVCAYGCCPSAHCATK